MKQLNPKQFIEAASPETLKILYVDGRWQVRSKDAVLLNHDGSTSHSKLEPVLSFLAGFGIRRCDVEWDGLPSTAFDTASENRRDS
jgi:hypothetical protein